MEEGEIVSVVKEILSVNVDDGIEFIFRSIEPIRKMTPIAIFVFILWRNMERSMLP